MASSSDDESDLSLIPDSVTNYHFVNGEESLISFSDLPQADLSRPEEEDSMDSQVYLHGTTEDGLQKVYQPVIAWKLELDRTSPETFVKSKDGKWIKLLKPRKIYEGTIRSILISVQMLHFVKWNLNALERSLWDHLRRVFDKFERRPSEDDLWSHLSFIKEFSQQHEDLKKSRLLKGLLERKGRRRTGEGNCSVPEVKEPFIAADDEEVAVAEKGNESDEDESDLFDSVCCICDNGGELLCCEGECMRSFHATKEAGVESDCKSLGMSSLQVEAIQNFHCKNCQVKRHQCFACGKLGNSDKTKGVPEVFQCSNATCGYFYHPNCVAKLLYPDDESLALECEKTVLDGKFACPSHRCHVCKKLEVKNDHELQFATCRRCPRSYHRKCMPWKIALENDATARGITTRAWEDLLPNRILIYCLKHKIEENLGTPIRNHIKFPSPLENKEKGAVSDQNNKSKPNFEKSKGPIKKRPLESKERVRSPSPVLSPKEQQNKRFKKGEGSSSEAVKIPSSRQVAASDSPKPSVRKIVKSSFRDITTEDEKKVKEIYQKTSSSVTMEDVLKKSTIPLTHQNTGRQIERVARGKIEGSVEAIQTAYQRICEGKSVDDAKMVCEPEVVKQVAKWNRRLGVYLSPFLHGMRYTSFGRHFTKEEKLEEIVSKLQWYVQTDDTIVDFCCGSNDFNRLMKQKMNTIGKNCNFKSYDIMWPKDDFCFEKRDWMTVQPKELPSGSSLIMGLNPPFGTKAALANKFIDKALTFKPKLLILIVPKETERLDKKRLGGTRYELIWEDNMTLSGKSFYLPGSVDESDNQMDQWNVSPPVLSLWSRSDWGARHNAIAEEQGHFSSPQNGILGVQNNALSKEEIERGEKEAEDIISQVVGDIVEENEGVVEGLEGEIENAEGLSENITEMDAGNGNNESLKGKEKVGPVAEEPKGKKLKPKGKEKGECKENTNTDNNNVLLKGKEKVEAVGEFKEGIVEEKTEDGDNEKEERESVVERERGRRPGKEISTSTAMRQDKPRKKSKESRPSEAMVVNTGLEEERETNEGERRLDEERERESGGDEGERELAEEREREEGEKKLSEEREREEKLFEEREREKRLSEEREQEKRLSEEREREKRLSEEREREKRLSEEREREKRLSEEREKEKRFSEEREREKKRLSEERENEKRLSEERESEKRLSEEREREKKLSVESERDMEAKKRRLREWNEKAAKRRAEEREKEKRLAEERERQRLADMERERQRLADEERERQRLAEKEEREKRLAEERRRPPFSSRERDSGPHFNRRSPIDSRERNRIRRSPSDPRERNRFRRSPSDPRERNNIRRSPSDPRERNNHPDYLGPHRNMEISPEKNTSYNNNNNNSKPLMEEPIETRHLSSQDDFSGLDDIEVIAKRYTSGPASSFNWNSTIGSGPGFRSGPDYNHYSMDNNTNNNNNNRDFDNFDDAFGRPFNGYNNTSSSYLYNNTSSSYLSSLGGTGTGTGSGSSAMDLYAPRLDETNFAGTSGSAIDRYAPRLDETNFTRPGPLTQAQFGNFGYGALSGPHMEHYDNVGVLRRDMLPQPQPDQLGFRARDPYMFGRPPPGSSGGWVDD